ncbi:MAG TPA: TonB-dependent receptor [Terriglobia bacterium]|nr:TonB-dependent receptor [Terriglobia bacterium]
MRRLIFAALLFPLLSTFAFAQTSNATLGGTVSDSTGALIPGVSITATNTATGIVTTVLSNEAGAYQFASLQTGTYTVSGELPGFRTQTYNGVQLGVSQQVRLNFTMQVSSVATAVEVTASADTLIATTSSSVGSVLPDYKVRDLPLAGRNVLDLVLTTAGAGPTASNGLEGYFAGSRLSSVNTTRDGFVVSDGRYDFGAFSNTYVSPDLVEEIRVITSTVDAEAGRGSGQVQMVTRSGTNQLHGSAFWANHNSALDASNWFNNFNGVAKNYQNRNQFGARVGGPIIKNKTFFFVLLDEQRQVFRRTFVGNVLTPLARQGIFRFYPGADNQNAVALNPSVDRSGNAIRPAGATGDLQSFSVFTRSDGTVRDSLRPGFDPTGIIQNTYLARMPLPNDYTVGDGLNTAGIRFTRHASLLDPSQAQIFDQDRNQFNARIDHNFNSRHKFSLVYTYEKDTGVTTEAGIMNWPGGYNGAAERRPRLFTGSLVSTLTPNLVNELRVGYKNSAFGSKSSFHVGRTGDDDTANLTPQAKEVFSLLPTRNGTPYVVQTTLFPETFLADTINLDGQTREARSPLYTYSDTISWNQGKHSYKTGFEFRSGSTLSWNDTWFTPEVTLGAGGPPVSNIDNVAIVGLTGNNQTTARNLLTDLSGSVAQIMQGFDIRDTKNPVFLGYADGVKVKQRDVHGREISGFFKDTWKVTSALTLNLGVRYDWYGVPWDSNGQLGRAVGAENGICGFSCGTTTTVQFVGKNSPNPDKQIYNDDYTNFAPAFGLSWSLPWFGKDKTVLRAGYGWSYVTNTLKNVPGNIAAVAGSLPGTFGGSGARGLIYTQAPYMSLASFTLPIPKITPLQPDPIDGQRANVFQMYASSRPNPYIQNFNFGLQRQLASNLTLDVAYVGSKGTSLYGGVQLNTVDIFKNQFLQAFNTTRAGGDAPLFDAMLRGLNIPGAGVVNGTTLTGSAALRTFTSTRTFIANGSVGQLADFLNRSTSVTGKGGGFVRNSGLFPENFFVLNPKFQTVTLSSNPGSSTYHSLQVQLTKRLSKGFTNSTSYVWSRALGENDGDAAIDYRDPNNQRLNKAVLGFHRTHAFITNGTYELPLGPGRPLLNNAPGWVQRLVERWQFGGIANLTSGQPFNVAALVSTVTQATSVSTPNIVGNFPKNMGQVTKLSNGVTYFPGVQQIADPARANVTTTNGLQGTFSNKAIADAQGNLLLVNPAPGQIGSMGLKWLEGPGQIRFDADLIKRVRITETKEFEFRLDAINILNHPVFGTPIPAGANPLVADINAPNFGRITTASGERSFVVNARLNF